MRRLPPLCFFSWAAAHRKEKMQAAMVSAGRNGFGVRRLPPLWVAFAISQRHPKRRQPPHSKTVSPCAHHRRVGFLGMITNAAKKRRRPPHSKMVLPCGRRWRVASVRWHATRKRFAPRAAAGPCAGRARDHPRFGAACRVVLECGGCRRFGFFLGRLRAPQGENASGDGERRAKRFWSAAVAAALGGVG